MKVVQVAPYPARDPVSGSQQRIAGLMAGRGDHEVERFAPRPGDGLIGDGRVETFDLGEGYREHQYRVGSQPVVRAASTVFPQWFSDVQPAFKALESQRMRIHAPDALRTALETADLVLVEHPWQYPFVARHSEAPVVYSSHNVEAEYHRFLADRRLTRPLLAAVERVERRAVTGADLVVTTSRRDADRYREAHGDGGRYHVAPNAVEKPASPGGEGSTAAADVPAGFLALFVGTAHRPNRVAVERLCAVAPEAPDVEFLVVGTVGSFFDAADLPLNVHLTGYVEDLQAHYAAADVALNPVTTGSGSNVKVPTYLANRLPVVTTPFGARGLPIADGEHCLVASMDAVPEVLSDAAAGAYDLEAIAARGYELVATDLNWTAVSTALFEEFEALVDAAG